MERIDCSVTVNFLQEKRRMCEYYDAYCSTGCPMGATPNSSGRLCEHLMDYKPEQAIELVQAWSDAHPKTTRLEDVLEKHPYMPLKPNGMPHMTPRELGYCKYCMVCPLGDKGDHYDAQSDECWKQPVVDGATGTAVTCK